MATLPPHRNLPRLLDHGDDGEVAFVLVEDVGAEDLEARWRRDPPVLSEVLRVATDVSAALAHLHDHGVVHLDVTEGNIIAAEGRFVLVDLGIGAPLCARRPVTVDGSGTEGRRAPETAHPSRRVTGAADVYVLATLLVEALLGGRAASWPPGEERQLLVCGLDRSWMSHRRLVRLISASLALNPSRRPSAAAFHREAAALSGDSGRWPQRPMWRAAVLGVVGVGMAGAAVAAFSATHAPPLTVTAGALSAAPQGFWGVPFFVDATSIGAMHHLPMWATTAPASTLESEVMLSLGPTPTWSAIPAFAGNALGGQAVDIDADGSTDLLVHELTPTRGERHRVLWGPSWVEDAARYPIDVEGRAFLVPDPRGSPRMLVWVEGITTERWPLAWLDIDGNGTLELLAADAEGLWLNVGSRSERLLEIAPLANWWIGAGESLAVADIDGDGDEDVVTVDTRSSAFVVLVDRGDRLVQGTLEGAIAPPISAQSSLGYSPPQLLDLDADGLPELLLPSGGFAPHSGPPLLWHNEGGLRFTPLALPWSEAHDGTRLLRADIDQDGQPELLDLSINDALLTAPDHRLWEIVIRGERRFRTFPEALPFGAVLRSLGEPWIHVVREAGPILVPTWAGPLFIRLPNGTEAPESGAAALPELSFESAPSVPAGLRPTWDAPAAEPRLFLEPQPEGGWEAVSLDPVTMRTRKLGVAGDMFDSAARDGDIAFSSRAGRLQRRDPRSYAALGDSVEVEGIGHCDGFGVAGGEVACCSRNPPVVAIYDADRLTPRAVVPVNTGPPCSLARSSEGWVVSTNDGAALLSVAGAGRVRGRLNLGAPAAVSAAGAALLLVSANEALWVRADLSLLGGVFSPGIATRHPVSEPWAPSASPSMADP